MNQHYTFFRKNFIVGFLLVALFAARQARATDLNAGELLFTGYHANASTTDAFSFVVLVNLSGTTIVSFTDNGWLSTNVFRAGEQTVTWTYTGTLVAGREIIISGPSAGAATAVLQGTGATIGSCSGSMPSFATSGDQVIAYRGSVGAPTLIAGLHMNVYSTDLGQCGNTTNSAWDPVCITDNANFSVMPQGLAAGFSTTWIGTAGVGASEQDNARFNCTGPLLTVAQVRAAVTNNANWEANSVAPPNFTLPAGCGFLGLTPLPVTLLSFNGHTSNSDIKLSWQTVNEQNHSHFEVEKSVDGRNFISVNAIAGQGGFSYLPFDYSFTDRNPVAGVNYYRLKIVSGTGDFKYSKTVRIIFGLKGKPVIISPNPASTDITITMPAALYTQVVVRNTLGMVVKQEQITTNNHRIDISGLSSGHYSIELIGSAHKLTERLLIVR